MNLFGQIKERIVYCDGGLGSLLQAEGLKAGELPGTWNITRPEVLLKIHRAYLDAGADIITTNTFGADSLKYHDQTEYTTEQIVRAGVRIVKQAIAESGRQAYTALDIGPTGKLLKPLGDLAFEDAYKLFQEVVLIGAEEGADLILIETMSDSYEAKAAVLAAKENSSLPVFVTVTFDAKGKLLTGGNAASVVAMLEGLGVDALGVNWRARPGTDEGHFKGTSAGGFGSCDCEPQCGLPRSEGGKTVYDIDSDEFAAEMKEIAEMGARVVGGCAAPRRNISERPSNCAGR